MLAVAQHNSSYSAVYRNSLQFLGWPPFLSQDKSVVSLPKLTSPNGAPNFMLVSLIPQFFQFLYIYYYLLIKLFIPLSIMICFFWDFVIKLTMTAENKSLALNKKKKHLIATNEYLF